MRLVGIILFGFLIAGCAAADAWAGASNGAAPMWTTPRAMAAKRVSGIPDTQQHSVAFHNLGCTQLTYRLVDHRDMLSDCFMPAAFGQMSTSYNAAIFNGTDEAVPLTPYRYDQVLVPWPKALNLITLEAADTGGTYLNMYTDPLAAMRDKRAPDGHLVAKELVTAPDVHFTDQTSGQGNQPLVVNSDTLAFSDSGNWMAVETLSGSFIRINLASLDQKAFAPSFGARGWPGKLFTSQVAVSDDGRFVAIGNNDFTSLKVYDLSDCSGKVCRSYDYWPFLKRQAGSLQRIGSLKFINDGLLSVNIITGDDQQGVYELAPAGQIDNLIDYLGLGDSYTSGEGAFNYLAGTDTPDNKCHLSVNSYPLLLARDLFGAGGGHSVACSGAVINDVASTDGRYRGQVRGAPSFDELSAGGSDDPTDQLDSIMAGFLPGYVAQQRFAAWYQPRVMTASVGGNDIGFGDILRRCVTPRVSRHWDDNNCYNTYESRRELLNLVDRTVPRWTALYRQLQAETPGSTIYAVGYPSIAAESDDCGLNVNLSRSELEFSEGLIKYLDGSIKQAATGAGVPYVDISDALVGHRLCETSDGGMAVNGLTAGDDTSLFGIGLLGHESYHPNALGQELIEQAVLRQTDNLSVKKTAPSPDLSSAPAPEPGNLLDVPASGRPLNTLLPDDITSRKAEPGQIIELAVDGAHDGVRPSSFFTVHLNGASGPSVGIVRSNANGDISGYASIADTVPPDAYTIDVVGPGLADGNIDITQPLYVVPAGYTEPPVVPGGKGTINDDGINGGSDTEGDNNYGHVGSGESPEPNTPVAGLGAASHQPQNPGHVLSAHVGQNSSTGHGEHTNQNGNIVSDRRINKNIGGHQPHTPLSLPKKSAAHSRLAAAFAIGIGAGAAFLTTFPGRWRIIKITGCYFGSSCNNWLIKGYEKSRRCFTIVIMRRFGAAIFCLILFVSLLALAVSVSANFAITNPKKIEKWLGQSGLYNSFAGAAVEQADKTAGNDQSGGVSLSDAAVKQAAEAAFPPQLIQRNVNLFTDSNYAWLEGKTDKPAFRIDLTEAKASFAQRVGKYVKTYLSGLPVCTKAQTAKIDLSKADPLMLECRPAQLDPAAESKLVTRQIENNGDFLDSPIITPDTVNSKGSGSDQDTPYYVQYASAPKAYQLGKIVPWVAGVFAVISAGALYLITGKRRQATKIIAYALLVAGVILVLTKLAADQMFRALEHHLFNQTAVGQLQKSLTVFLQHIENQLVKIDLWFGVGYLVLAAILIGALILTRQRGLRIPKPLQALTLSDKPERVEPADESAVPREKIEATRPGASANASVAPKLKSPPMQPPQKPRRPKPPRLVQ